MIAGCGSSQQFAAVPADIDRNSVPQKTLEMTAQHFHFTPEEVHVPQGTLVTLKITAIDGTHGFSLGAFGIDETIPEKESRTVTFYAGKKGEYGFHCSHFCGIGHLGMTGKIIVD
jgi:heme/copper-type cytochrome/quinol oxidase subunit 2